LIPKSLRWYPPQSFHEGQSVTAAPESGTGSANVGINGKTAGTLDANYHKGTGMRSGIEREVVLCAATGQSNAEILADRSPTLNCNCEQPYICKEQKVFGICSLASNSMKSSNPHSGVYEAETSRTLDLNCGNPSCNQVGMAVVAFNGGASPQAGSIAYSEKVSPTLKSASSGLRTPCVCEPATVILNDQGGDSLNVEKNGHAPTLRANTHGNLPIVCAEGDSLPAVTMRVRCGCEGNLCGGNGGKGALLQTEKSGTLATRNDQTLFCADTHANTENCDDNRSDTAYGFDLQQITSKTNRSTLKNIQPSLCAAGNPHVAHPEITGTLCASAAGLSRPGGMGSETDLTVAYCLQGNMVGREDKNGPSGSGVNKEVCFTLNAVDRPAVVYNRQRSDLFKEQDIASTQSARQYKDATDLICAVDCRNFKEFNEISGTLQAKTTSGYSLNFQNPVREGYVVRRLTPVECERLMGFPDGWTEYGHDGRPISDRKRYSMLGNSIATPCAAYIIQGILEQYKKEDANWKLGSTAKSENIPSLCISD
ncbi:MAG: DNA cytosine methyltransferase, partial [Eubacteriales bacterium]|nr:DNA cytosine methyltransferase [Eubacteriales bacterium]